MFNPNEMTAEQIINYTLTDDPDMYDAMTHIFGEDLLLKNGVTDAELRDFVHKFICDNADF